MASNPNGYSLTARLKHCLTKPLEEPGKDATAGELLVHATLKAAIATKAVPFIEVWNRAEGRVKEPESDKVLPPINFVFILPDGTQVSPVAFREVQRLGNGNQT